MNKIKKTITSITICSFFFMLIGCKIALAPSYNPEIVEKANLITTETMRFFAQVSDGATKETFVKREENYNILIGTFDALAIQSRARPLPSNSVTKKIDNLLKDKKLPVITDAHPSAVAFESIAATLSKMKMKDQENGLNTTVVGLFKNQITVFLDQAITYENFLKR